jgi:hypothetical protein
MIACNVASLAFAILGWRTASIIIGIAGVPLHELGHVLACLLFRVPIRSIDWLHIDDEGGPGGSVKADMSNTTAFAAIAIAIAPIISCWSFVVLFTWLFVTWPTWGYDPAWQLALLWLIASTSWGALPSRADMRAALHVNRLHPGQCSMAIMGIVLGVAIAWWINLPLAEWWQCMVGLVVVLAPGWMFSTIYAKKKG